MPLRKIIPSLMLGCLLVAVSACSTAPKINSMKLGKDEKVSKQEDTFQAGETVYAVAEITNAGSQSKARFRLVYEDVAGQKSGEMVTGAEKILDVEGDKTVTFFANLPSGFQNGRYALQLRLADKDDNPVAGQSATFTVSGGSAGKAPAVDSNTPAAGNSNPETAGRASLYRLKLTAQKGAPIESPGATSFSPGDLIYVIYTLDNTIGGDKVFGKLYAEQVEGIQPGKIVRSVSDSFPTGNPRTTGGFQLDPQEMGDDAWAKGTYRFELLYAPDADTKPTVLKSITLTVE
jgi:hypothetical protein